MVRADIIEVLTKRAETRSVTLPKSSAAAGAADILARHERSSPLLAIAGRPNVGKSTLFNRLVGSRRAIVGDEPGITRDRLYGESEWRGHAFRVVDTGGIIPEDKDFIPAEIFRQARVAFDEAAAIVRVVDGRSELAAPDLELVRLLRKTGKPLFLAVNKIDSDKQIALAGEFHRLGVEVFQVSAEHGRGVDDVLDAFVASLPARKESQNPFTKEDAEVTEETVAKPGRNEPIFSGRPTTDDQRPTTTFIDQELHAEPVEVKVAIIGHPNVGKSTLLNQLTGTSRAIVSPIPGTTRDAVDEIVERDGRRFRFIDTAGIRRKGKTRLLAEKLSVVMSRKHLEDADIALLVIDATEGVSDLDAIGDGPSHQMRYYGGPKAPMWAGQ